jgi:hypothetical protein
MEFFEMPESEREKLALSLLEKFIPDYQLGERNGSRFLIVCNASYRDIENLVVEARRRLREDNDLSSVDHLAFEEIISPLIDWCQNWGFEDEYRMCDGCRNIIALYRDYRWGTEDGIFCEECVRIKFHEGYFNSLVDNPNSANTLLDEDYILKQGYIKLDREWCSSFHGGHRDDPEKVLEKLHEQGWNKVVFGLETHEPFTLTWSAFVENDNIKIKGHVGEWYIISTQEHRGQKLFLLEHSTYGDEAASLIVDEELNVVLDDVWNGLSFPDAVVLDQDGNPLEESREEPAGFQEYWYP